MSLVGLQFKFGGYLLLQQNLAYPDQYGKSGCPSMFGPKNKEQASQGK